MSDIELSRVIGLIMENPTLLEEIKKLASGESNSDGGGEVGVSAEASTDTPREVTASNAVPTPPRASNSRRKELLYALTPYISESRRRAIESFMTIADILEVMRGK